MCFAPQRRAFFRHLNFQKWSEHGVLCTFWLGHALRATTACFFLTSQLPKVVRSWCVLYILTSKCASRNFVPQRREIVHLWPAGSAPAALASLLFGPPEPHIIGKTQCFATFLPFRAPASTFFWLFLSLIFSLLLFSSLFFCSTSAIHLSMLSEVWLLNFLRLADLMLTTLHTSTCRLEMKFSMRMCCASLPERLTGSQDKSIGFSIRVQRS